jgi:heme-degrading monooxygenase HmoA
MTVESQKALFVGDLLYNNDHNYIREYTPTDSSDELDNWIAGLNELKTNYASYSYAFVGHGAYRTDVSTLIDENIAYLTDAKALIKGTKRLTSDVIATSVNEVTDELNVLYPNYSQGALRLSQANGFFPGDPGANWFLGQGLSEIVVEVTTFNLNAGIDSSIFQARDAQIENDFASVQPGFLKRLSALDANGKYVIMVFWETLADADASIAAFGIDPTVADYFAMINGSTFLAERFTTFALPNINFSLDTNNVIEITTFDINSEVVPSAFETRDAQIEQDFTSKQAGFIRRSSGVDANGKYPIIVFWDALQDADNSIAAFGSDATVADYFAMIDTNTFTAERFSIFK